MVESSQGSIRLLFIVSANAGVPELIARMKTPLTAPYDIVTSPETYDALPEKYVYDALVIFWGAHVAPIINDQVLNSQKVRWVQALSAGIDGYMQAADFRASAIPLTNVKGAFSHVLAEYIALGMLYHAKSVELFAAQKNERVWKKGPIALCSQKTMAIVGYGDIGSECARICKAFGTKIIGVKRRPEQTSDQHRSYCDEIVGLDQLERVYAEADFVVGVLPKTAGTVDFFNNENCFSKMKHGAVFMNIGRGPTVREPELIGALKSGQLSGAVLDVFTVEPLPQESDLWTLPNVLITPHCADQDDEFMDRAMVLLAENLENFKTGSALKNICDKLSGY